MALLVLLAASCLSAPVELIDFDYENSSLSGSIGVANLAFVKTLRVYYSTSSGIWKPDFFIEGSYNSSISSEYEVWHFQATSNDISYGSQYMSKAGTFYDNNYQSNYLVTNSELDAITTNVNILGPASQKILLRAFVYNHTNNELSGHLYVHYSLANCAVSIYTSDSNGNYSESKPYIPAYESSQKSKYVNYLVYTFQGSPFDSGAGFSFYIAGVCNNTIYYDTNGCDTCHYRTYPPRYTSSNLQAKTIYQIVTDRFARTDLSDDRCLDYDEYCGGTWAGITRLLEYVSESGYDYIWISPVVQNTDGGYHGYWAKDFTQLNSKFGTPVTLLKLIARAHKLNVLLITLAQSDC